MPPKANARNLYLQMIYCEALDAEMAAKGWTWGLTKYVECILADHLLKGRAVSADSPGKFQMHVKSKGKGRHE